jgi:hypothetical protein
MIFLQSELLTIEDNYRQRYVALLIEQRLSAAVPIKKQMHRRVVVAVLKC